MKLLVLFACSLVIGCGVIFGLVRGIVPHLVEPTFFPTAQARESAPSPTIETIKTAGGAVHTGAENQHTARIADSR